MNKNCVIDFVFENKFTLVWVLYLYLIFFVLLSTDSHVKRKENEITALKGAKYYLH